MKKRELMREAIVFIITLIFLSGSLVYAQQKIDSKRKSPLPPIPTWFSIEYFDQYIGRSPMEIRQVFKEGTKFKYVTKQECIDRGWRDMLGKDVDLFMREEIVNSYVMDRAFIYVWYSKTSNYTKCDGVKFRIPLWRLNDYEKELAAFGYTDQPNEFRQEGYNGLMKTFVYRKSKRVVKIFITAGEQTIMISILKTN